MSQADFTLYGRNESCPPSPTHGFPDFSDSELFPGDPVPSLDPFSLLTPPRQSVADSSLTVEQSLESENSTSSKKSNRGRKRGTSADVAQRKVKRAESNRKFARESRRRRTEYVKSLEAEVLELRQQVEFYRSRLGKYELIERQRNVFGYELYEEVAEVTEEMRAMHQDPNDRFLLYHAMAKKFDQFVEDRRKTIEQLARAMVEVVAPLPQRFFFWAAENNIDMFDTEKMLKASNYAVPADTMKSIVELITNSYTDTWRGRNEIRLFFATAGVRIRSLVKQLIDCQKQIQEETKRVAWFGFTHVLHNIDIRRVQCFAQFAASMKLRPELSDCSLYQLSQADFGMASSFVAIANELAKRKQVFLTKKVPITKGRAI